ncbi:MAG: hypothetical protein WAO55_12215 [Candidatus Manganitrophaceae bacterium]
MKVSGRIWVVAIVAGWIGGAASGWLFGSRDAVAQKFPSHSKSVTAEDFHLVDKEGKLRGALFVSPKGGSGFALFDTEGKPRFEAVLAVDGKPELKLLNQEGQAIWQAPLSSR